MIMASGLIFDIQRFCLHDGPGIRTTVFFKGCTLRCRWCHNPESVARGPEVYFWAQRCVRCGACARACARGAISSASRRRVLRRRCDACGACARACPAGALEVIGRRMTVREVLAVVGRDEPFYRSAGGGVTLSGGEPLAQLEFALELMEACRAAGLHVALDTAANVPAKDFAAAVAAADLVLFDLKHPDPQVHRRFTGASNARVLGNLAVLSRAGVPFIARVPVIPGFSDSSETLLAIARLAADAGATELDLLPYHTLGEPKRRRLGRGRGWPAPRPRAGIARLGSGAVRLAVEPAWLAGIQDRACQLLPTRIGGMGATS